MRNAFWIALPEGWQRSDHDPEFQRRLGDALRDYAPALHHGGVDTDLVRVALASIERETASNVVFAANLFTMFDDPGIGALQASLTCTIESGHETTIFDDDPLWDSTPVDLLSGMSCIRRTCLERVDLIEGIDMIGHCQYFLRADDAMTIAVRFSSISVTVWDALLPYFDAIAETVQLHTA